MNSHSRPEHPFTERVILAAVSSAVDCTGAPPPSETRATDTAEIPSCSEVKTLSDRISYLEKKLKQVIV